MSQAPHTVAAPDDERRMHRIYVGVIVVEVVTLLCLLAFQQYFGR